MPGSPSHPSASRICGGEGRPQLKRGFSMNCTLLQSPGKSMVSISAQKISSICRNWPRALAVTMAALLCIGSAFASQGTLVAPGVNQPKGAIRWNGSVWVADVANGFCRIDGGALNPATCFAPGKGQPELDGNIVYTTDPTGASGVWRLTMTDIGSAIASAVQLAPNGGLAGNLPTSASLGPDGKLYVSFTKTGDIKRITNPAGAAQTVESVGKAASGGGPVNSLAFVNGDLYLADAGLIGLERISNAAACNGGCNAISLFGVLGISQGLSSDRTRFLFMGNGTQVLRYDASTSNQVDVFSTSGLLNGLTYGYGTVWGVTYDVPSGDVFIGGDPTPPGAATSNIGALWVVLAPWVTEGAVNTLSGPPAPAPPPSSPPPAARTASLYAAGITQPRGLLWIGTHAWVSDASQGFCRIDSSSPGVAALSNCFKPTPTFQAGQASFDPVTNMIYLPDANTASAGIFRISYSPATETLGTVANLGQGSAQPTSVAVGAEGSLYFGVRTSGNISKILTPATAPAAPVRIANTSNGKGPLALLFIGNDLYLAETVNVTVIIRASPSLTRGTAVIVGGPVAKGATPALNVTTPLSLAADMSNPSNPVLYIGSDPLGLGGFGQVDQWNILLQKDTVWVDSGLIGSVLTPFAYPAGMAIAPGGNLYTADDPSVTSSGTTTTPGQGHVYLAPAF